MLSPLNIFHCGHHRTPQNTVNIAMYNRYGPMGKSRPACRECYLAPRRKRENDRYRSRKWVAGLTMGLCA